MAPVLVIVAGLTCSCSRPEQVEETNSNGVIIPMNPAEQAQGRVQGYTMVGADRCMGYLDSAAKQPEPGAYNPAGWAWNASAAKKPEKVVIAVANGTVVGTTGMTVPRPDVQKAVPAITELNTGYITKVTLPPHSTIRAYAVMEDGKSACPLQNVFKLP